MTTALEHDILAELRERDLEVQVLRRQLAERGQHPTHERLYETLVAMEARHEVRLDAAVHRKPLWGAR